MPGWGMVAGHYPVVSNAVGYSPRIITLGSVVVA